MGVRPQRLPLEAAAHQQVPYKANKLAFVTSPVKLYISAREINFEIKKKRTGFLD
jgi:hypothetical protein